MYHSSDLAQRHRFPVEGASTWRKEKWGSSSLEGSRRKNDCVCTVQYSTVQYDTGKYSTVDSNVASNKRKSILHENKYNLNYYKSLCIGFSSGSSATTEATHHDEYLAMMYLAGWEGSKSRSKRAKRASVPRRARREALTERRNSPSSLLTSYSTVVVCVLHCCASPMCACA